MSTSSSRLLFIFLVLAATLSAPFADVALAQSPQAATPLFNIGVNDLNQPQQMSVALKIIALMTVLSLAPSFVIMVTSFTRIAIVLSLMRRAIGTQTSPPNQIIMGMALFLTVFIMTPVWQKINSEALQPYLNEEISQAEAFDKAVTPLRHFMLKQTREKDLALFVEISKTGRPATPDDLPLTVLIPSFVISELKTAFQIGMIIFIPFLIIDMVVASVLLSMGMMMLPPMMVSLPFKLMLFVLVDGWYLLIGSLVKSFG